MGRPTAESIDVLLPQTQCTRCGFDGCLPYAEAIAAGHAKINQCPPGGAALIGQLAQLLGGTAMPLNPANGVEAAPLVAFIDEQRCIGCYKCIAACPVDAIVGAKHYMHTVIAAECSGCGLCLAPCPVDCIAMLPRPAALPAVDTLAGFWRQRHVARKQRLLFRSRQRAEARRKPSLPEQAREFDIAAAIARARARRGSPAGRG